MVERPLSIREEDLVLGEVIVDLAHRDLHHRFIERHRREDLSIHAKGRPIEVRFFLRTFERERDGSDLLRRQGRPCTGAGVGLQKIPPMQLKSVPPGCFPSWPKSLRPHEKSLPPAEIPSA